jgi:cyclase
LLKGNGLVKTVRFARPSYLGDPINIARLFNDKEADELIILDIDATRERRRPRFDYIGALASECFMPVCYGGGITSVEDVRDVLSTGVEKVALNTAAVADPSLVSRVADIFGSQAIVVSIDVKKDWLGRERAFTAGGTRNSGLDPVALAIDAETRGAGEILLGSIERDGTMQGYDTDMIARVAGRVTIPVVACGGAGTYAHLADAVRAGASAGAAGSMFVYQGPHRAVLINYPSGAEMRRIFGDADAGD